MNRLIRPFALAAAFMTAGELGAQEWRSLQSARQLHDTGAYEVRVRYATGHLDITPAASPFLYRMNLYYDAERSSAIHSLENGRVLTLGVARESNVVTAGRSADENRMDLALSPEVPIELSLGLGAVQADLDLGGMSLTSLEIRAGANDTHVEFEVPNRVAMRSLEVEAGAASVHLTSIANANAALLRVETGVGSVELDFRGTWTRDLAASVEVGFGALKLIVPEDVGVRLEVGKVMARVTADGLVSRDGVLVSDNWETARYKLTVRAKTVLGTVDVRRVPR